MIQFTFFCRFLGSRLLCSFFSWLLGCRLFGGLLCFGFSSFLFFLSSRLLYFGCFLCFWFLCLLCQLITSCSFSLLLGHFQCSCCNSALECQFKLTCSSDFVVSSYILENGLSRGSSTIIQSF